MQEINKIKLPDLQYRPYGTILKADQWGKSGRRRTGEAEGTADALTRASAVPSASPVLLRPDLQRRSLVGLASNYFMAAYNVKRMFVGDMMKIKKKLLGLAMLAFGLGILANVLLPVVGFFTGVLFVFLGAVELFC